MIVSFSYRDGTAVNDDSVHKLSESLAAISNPMSSQNDFNICEHWASDVTEWRSFNWHWVIRYRNRVNWVMKILWGWRLHVALTICVSETMTTSSNWINSANVTAVGTRLRYVLSSSVWEGRAFCRLDVFSEPRQCRRVFDPVTSLSDVASTGIASSGTVTESADWCRHCCH